MNNNCEYKKKRVWVKQWIVSMFCCEKRFWISTLLCECHTNYPRGLEEDLDPDDRGQSNQHPGYRRRKIQFFFLGQLASISANVFFLAFAPTVRYGFNGAYYPYRSNPYYADPITQQFFLYALFYAGGMTIVHTTAIFVGWYVFRRWWPISWNEVRAQYASCLKSPLYSIFLALLIVSNVALSVYWLLAQNRIYFWKSLPLNL